MIFSLALAAALASGAWYGIDDVSDVGLYLQYGARQRLDGQRCRAFGLVADRHIGLVAGRRRRVDHLRQGRADFQVRIDQLVVGRVQLARFLVAVGTVHAMQVPAADQRYPDVLGPQRPQHRQLLGDRRHLGVQAEAVGGARFTQQRGQSCCVGRLQEQRVARVIDPALDLAAQLRRNLDPAFRQELLGITDITLSLIIMVVVMVNSVFYLYLLFAKKWAYQYVISYTVGAAALCILTLFEGFPVGGLWEGINILSFPSYLALSLIIWSRKAELSQTGFKFSPKV